MRSTLVFILNPRRFAPPPQFLNRSMFRKVLKQKGGAPGSAKAGLFDAGIECHRKENLCWSSSGLHKPARAIIRKQFPVSR